MKIGSSSVEELAPLEALHLFPVGVAVCTPCVKCLGKKTRKSKEESSENTALGAFGSRGVAG